MLNGQNRIIYKIIDVQQENNQKAMYLRTIIFFHIQPSPKLTTVAERSNALTKIQGERMP